MKKPSNPKRDVILGLRPASRAQKSPTYADDANRLSSVGKGKFQCRRSSCCAQVHTDGFLSKNTHPRAFLGPVVAHFMRALKLPHLARRGSTRKCICAILYTQPSFGSVISSARHLTATSCGGGHDTASFFCGPKASAIRPGKCEWRIIIFITVPQVRHGPRPNRSPKVAPFR